MPTSTLAEHAAASVYDIVGRKPFRLVDRYDKR
jgi:hypothetical protein